MLRNDLVHLGKAGEEEKPLTYSNKNSLFPRVERFLLAIKIYKMIISSIRIKVMHSLQSKNKDRNSYKSLRVFGSEHGSGGPVASPIPRGSWCPAAA